MSFKNQFIGLSFSVTQEGGAFAWSCYCICGPTVGPGTWQREMHLCGKRTQHRCLRPVNSTFSTNHCTLAGRTLGRSEAGKGGIERHARAFYSKSKWEGSESWKPGSHVIRSPLHAHPQFPSPLSISQDAIWLMDWLEDHTEAPYVLRRDAGGEEWNGSIRDDEDDIHGWRPN